VALKQKLGKMSAPAKRSQLAKECEGKVVAGASGLVLRRGNDVEIEMMFCF
jgi:hypothetical protein